MHFTKPNVILSNCLEMDACRYNGQMIPCGTVRLLEPFVRYITVCPEMEIGLGVPRDPIRIVLAKGVPRLIQPYTGLDCTDSMTTFANRWLNDAGEVDGAILKHRSPSCGINDVKVYALSGGPGGGKRAGFFGGMVKERLPKGAVEDEGRLNNYIIRDHFYTALFAFAQLREVLATKRIGELVQFHSEYKLLLMAYNQKEMRLLGPILASYKKGNFSTVADEYRHHFQLALAHPPRPTANINVLQHAQGYFSGKLTSAELALFNSGLERYRQNQLPLSALLSMVRLWIARWDEQYLAQQRFFTPYPEQLIELSDSGKGRDN